jgi:broad specificity polyphosphatase/5'/3'-nucleotidase SurE
MLLNVNVPPGVEPDGYTVTRLGRHSYGAGVIEKVDPRGRKHYWIGGNEYQHEDIPGSDCNVVYREQRVSVTPLQMESPRNGSPASLVAVGSAEPSRTSNGSISRGCALGCCRPPTSLPDASRP